MNVHISIEPSKSLLLVKLLAENRLRLFSLSEAREIARSNNLDIREIKDAVFLLASQGWIHQIKKGLYALDSIYLSGQPIHEFEIATRLVVPSAISHFSAFHHHELTDQIPHMVFTTVITGSTIPRSHVGNLFIYKGVRYQYIQVKKEHFFGIETMWISDAKIPITDLERTLIDGLLFPKYCGGFNEVLHAFSTRDIDVIKIIKYALRMGVSTAKRLGWVLDRMGVPDKDLAPLIAVPAKSYIKLVTSNENVGPYNKKWKIRENGQ